MTVRADLAAAANGAGMGLNVAQFYRQTAKVMDGWVSLVGMDRDDTGFGFMDRWQVTVVLHQDVKAAELWIEANVDALLAALAPQLIVTTVVPAQLTLDLGRVPGLVVEGVRAH